MAGARDRSFAVVIPDLWDDARWRDEVGVRLPGSANLASFNQDMTDAHPWRSDEVRTKERK